MPTVELTYLTGPQIMEKMARRPVLKEEVLPLREFEYKEEANSNGDRKVTLVKGAQKFSVSDPHAKKQLCGLIRYPAKVFDENEPALNMRIMAERLRGVRASNHLVKWVDGDDGRELRAVLPHPYTSIRDQDLVKIAIDSFPDVQFNKPSLDSYTTTMRLVSPRDEFDIEGEKLRLAANLSCSEVGDSKLVVDTMIFVPRCTNGNIVTWGSARYFTHNYREVQANDLRDVYSNLLTRYRLELENIRRLLVAASRKKYTHDQVVEMWNRLKVHRSASKGFIEEIESGFVLEAETTQKSHWELVQHITQKAQDLPAEQRIRHEVFAGMLLELDLDPSRLERAA